MAKKLTFKEITCSESEEWSTLYGLTNDGKVYRYNDTKEQKGWHALPMNEVIQSNPKNDADSQ